MCHLSVLVFLSCLFNCLMAFGFRLVILWLPLCWYFTLLKKNSAVVGKMTECCPLSFLLALSCCPISRTHLRSLPRIADGACSSFYVSGLFEEIKSYLHFMMVCCSIPTEELGGAGHVSASPTAFQMPCFPWYAQLCTAHIHGCTYSYSYSCVVHYKPINI